MKAAISLFESLLATCEKDGIAPLNGEERLHFVKKNVTNFAAYRQLDELFIETKKKIAAKSVQQKTVRQSNK